MNNHQRQQLEQRLEQMSKTERARLFKQAAQYRIESQRSKRTIEDPDSLPRAKRKNDSVREWALKLLAERPAANEPETPHSPANHRVGVVVSVGRRSCVVDDAGEQVACLLSPDLASQQHHLLAVGDDAAYQPTDPGGRARLLHVLPRRTFLARPDPRHPGRLRVIVANVDAVIIVVSVVAPALHPRLIDRYLIAVEQGGAQPLICVNKIDALPPTDRSALSVLEPYRRIGLTVIETSTATGAGIEQLRAAIATKTCAFVGHSGVGKSSLSNAMLPAHLARVGNISDNTRKGQHTTTSSTLYRLADGTRIIDTPGVRSFGLDHMTSEDVRQAFAEFEPYLADCRFSDCTHTHEPLCGVKTAVAQGQLPAERYDTYLRICRELAGEPTPRIRPASDQSDLADGDDAEPS